MARKISARELVADIKSGISYDALIGRYALSDQEAEKAFSKLVSAGLVRIDELPTKFSTESTYRDPRPVSKTVPSFRCPVCGTVAVEGDTVCVQCGMKLEGSDSAPESRERPIMGTDDRSPGYTVYQPPTELSQKTLWLIVSAAVACLVLLCATGIWWIQKDAEEQRRREALRHERIEAQRRLAAEAQAKQREGQEVKDAAGKAFQAKEEEIRRQAQVEERVKELDRRIRFRRSE
jgi:hypothetical protein